MTNSASDHSRHCDIMRQGFTKRLPQERVGSVRRRLKEIDAALAGKLGYQSAWAIETLKAERTALLGKR